MLQDRTIPISSMNITSGCIFKNAVAPLFQSQYAQSAQQVPSTMVQMSSMIANCYIIFFQYRFESYLINETFKL